MIVTTSKVEQIFYCLLVDLSGFGAYIDTFESALSETLRLHASIQERVAVQTSSLTLHHGELHQKSVQLATAFERTFQSFSSLERRFDQMEGHAVRAGLALEKLHREQRRARDALQIVQLFREFVGEERRGPAAGRLQAVLFEDGGTISFADRKDAVRTLKRLLVIAKTDIPGTERGRGQIEAMAERLENNLLTTFHEAFEQGNTDGMRDAASLLIAYNGGHSCVQSFVSQHAFFVDPIQAESIQSRYHPEANNGLPLFIDLNQEEPLDPVLEVLFGQIGQTAEADWKYLCLVFRRPSRVMDRLLTRVFHEPLQVHLEELLRQAKGHSALAYLRSLQTSYKATKVLCEGLLGTYERQREGDDDDDDADAENDVDIDDGAAVKDAESGAPARLLKELLRHLFSPYLDSEAYAAMETSCLVELLTMAACPLQAYCRSQASRSLGRGNLFSGITAAMTGSVDIGGGGGMTPADQLVMAMQYRFGPDQRPLVTAEEGNLGIPCRPVIERCLVLFGEALIRASTLPPPIQRY